MGGGYGGGMPSMGGGGMGGGQSSNPVQAMMAANPGMQSWVAQTYVQNGIQPGPRGSGASDWQYWQDQMGAASGDTGYLSGRIVQALTGGGGGGGGDASQQQAPPQMQLGGFGGSNLSFGSAPSFGPIRSYSDPTGGGLAAYAQQALGTAGQTPSFGGGGMSAAPSMAAPSYGGGASGALQAAAPSLMPSYSGGGMQAAPMSAMPSYGGGGFSGFTGMSTAPSGSGVTPMFQLQQGGGGAPGAL
jgi:hypothetical protein